MQLRFRAQVSVVALLVGLAGIDAQAGFTLQPLVIKRVVDGDTVHGADDKGKLIKVRMQGMDTPEVHLMTDEGAMAQLPWGEQASKSLAKLVRPGDKVTLKSFGTDKYGRALGQVLLADRNLNLEQVKLGQAVSYALCEAGKCTEELLKEQQVAEFAEACRKAQSEQLGIFDPRQPLDEMPFEFRLRMQKRKAEKFVGDLRSREYVKPEDYKEVPVCERIFFWTEEDAKNLGYKLKTK